MLQAAETAISEAGEAVITIGVACITVIALLVVFRMAKDFMRGGWDPGTSAAEGRYVDSLNRRWEEHGYDGTAGPRGRLP